MTTWSHIENCIICITIAAITLGVYAMGGGMSGAWSFVLTLWMNYSKS